MPSTRPRPLTVENNPVKIANTAPPQTQVNQVVPLLGSDAQKLIDCNQRLTELDIDETITLPQICVIGDQSTGKSSLIEAISTVQVPKAKGCCTQCPIAINLLSGLTENSPWTCSVFIEQKYDFVEAYARKVTKTNPLGPWQPRREPNVTKLETTQDKSRVGHLIRVAQAAVLDPGRNPAYYMSSAEAMENATQVAMFSPNVIRLDISEGKWANLSFIDLPGVIANTGKLQDRYLVELIKNLVQHYAEDQRSINLLTLPMTHDVANSQACAIIQNLKAEDRTLAVFTKSDLADDEQRQQFVDKIVGKDNELGFEHGYHVVMMPDSVDINQATARQHEADFFEQPHWRVLQQQSQHQFGIPALSDYLRRLLFEKTRETLPSNLKAIRSRLATVNDELENLPPPPDQVLLPLKLSQDIAKFEYHITELFSKASTRKVWNEKAAEFRSKIIKSRPTLVLQTSTETDAFDEAKQKLRSDVVETSSPEKKPKGRTAVKREPSANGIPATTAKPEPIYKFGLEEIREINKNFYSAYHPSEVDPKAIDEMNKLSVRGWNVILDEHMTANSKLLMKDVHGVFEVVLSKYRHLQIYSVIGAWLKRYIDAVFTEEWSLADEVCKREQNRPFTMDRETLKIKEEQCLIERRRKRADFRSRFVKTILDSKEGVVKKRPEALEANLGPDEYDTEIQISAKNRAYYDIAACRFTDIISQSIFYNLLPKCDALLVDGLKAHIGVDDPARHPQIVDWMAEDQEREALRRRLQHEKKQLVEGHSYIKGVLGQDSPTKHCHSSKNEIDEPLESPTKRSKVSHSKSASIVRSSKDQSMPDLMEDIRRTSEA